MKQADLKKILCRLGTMIIILIIFISSAGKSSAISDLTALCHDGMYDYCSQAPKCGGYPVWDSAWDQKSRDLWNRYQYLFQFCQYKNCQGYVPLCCYEMVRTQDIEKCGG